MITVIRLSAFIALAALVACAKPAPPHYTKTQTGVSVTPTSGAAKSVRLEVLSAKVIRVTAFPTAASELPQNLIAVRQADGSVPFDVVEQNGAVVLKTAELSAEVAVANGATLFRDKEGHIVITESPGGRTFTPAEAEGKHYYAIRQEFDSRRPEAFYGLGQHQNGQMNYKGENVELAQHNMDVAIPFVVSSRNYGVLWNNESITRFGDPRPWQPIGETLTLRDAQGKEGGLTAQYSVGGKVVLTRVESDIGYQYIKSLESFPADLAKAPNQHVTWTGTIEARTGGVHKFSLYASDYHKLYIDDKLVLDGWRQNWNPWYRNFEIDLRAGKPRKIRIEWDRTVGYLALVHRDPLQPGEQDALSLFSELGEAIDYYFIVGANTDDVIGGYRFVTGKAALLP